jgi:hypothetical protein
MIVQRNFAPAYRWGSVVYTLHELCMADRDLGNLLMGLMSEHRDSRLSVNGARAHAYFGDLAVNVPNTHAPHSGPNCAVCAHATDADRVHVLRLGVTEQSLLDARAKPCETSITSMLHIYARCAQSGATVYPDDGAVSAAATRRSHHHHGRKGKSGY